MTEDTTAQKPWQFTSTLPEGVRPTKALRFTLPESLATLLEGMTKEERDLLLATALTSKVRQFKVLLEGKV